MISPAYRYQGFHLELTTACNFRCPYCPLVDLQRPPAQLPYELAESILRQCVDDRLADHVLFHVIGEPLLHPQLLEILALGGRLGIRTSVATNGSLYREDTYRALYARLDTLHISYRTVDDLEIETVQKKLTHQEYLEKILAAIRLRAALPESKTQIFIRLFISPKTIPSIRTLGEMIRDQIAETCDLSAVTGAGRLHHHQTITVLPWLSFACDKQRDWRKSGRLYRSYFGNCREFEAGFAILANGDVVACCWDVHGGNAMGNVARARLTDILDSEKARALRRSFRRHVCPTETCRVCLGRRGLARSLAYQVLSLANLR